ncbi:MAG: glutamate--tRNA ligase [Synergistaceae bacterium]|nr:glutamate--tRNA ligase [Synergistaceae bacterium]
MRVRARFAPSPTGELHIGGARTALFNWLFARSFGGRFILRVDDTDSERSRREYETKLMDDLRWLGLDWDEGPDKPSETGRPYRQSERLNLYAQWMDRLRERGAVYPCFCSEERLSAMREGQLSRGEPPRYDGRCRSLSPDEARRRMDAGERPCWRLALPEGYSVTFEDAVRGPQSFPAGTVGDFVVQRADGTPTYLFASAVDDYLMEITHVLRGDEHIPNTARQLAIIDLMGWPRPVFAHIPMVLSEDRRKLGKRTGSAPIREYRERGFLPEALTAYLATLSWNPEKVSAPFDLRGLATVFSLDRIVRSSPVHDEEHLLHWQREAMGRRGGEWLAAQLAERDPRLVPFRERLAPLIEDMVRETPFLEDIRGSLDFLTERPVVVPDREEWIVALASVLENLEPWDAENIEKALRSFMKERGLKGREFFHPLRLTVTGRDRGASLPLILFTLGRGECAARLNP